MAWIILWFIILLLGSIHRGMSQITSVNISQEFERWMIEHERTYPNNSEKERRFGIFRTRFESIKLFNTQQEGKTSSFKKGINMFSDMTAEEFLSIYASCHNDDPSKYISSFGVDSTYVAEDDYADIPPVSIDWRDEKLVTPVKNQGHCGSCWAFAAVAAVEGSMAWNYGINTSLSEQQILDCSGNADGCKGGFTAAAFDYVIRNGGLNSEANYGYVAKQGTCDSSKTDQHLGQITGYKKVPPNEYDLAKAVAWQPIPVVISVGAGFQEYQSGILRGGCSYNPYKNRHAVLIVGYGRTEDYHEDYWIVKNSWGEDWGEKGYVRMYKGVNLCKIADNAISPLNTYDVDRRKTITRNRRPVG
ncbi:unnamed protein product [Prunus brigantina]